MLLPYVSESASSSSVQLQSLSALQPDASSCAPHLKLIFNISATLGSEKALSTEASLIMHWSAYTVQTSSVHEDASVAAMQVRAGPMIAVMPTVNSSFSSSLNSSLTLQSPESQVHSASELQVASVSSDPHFIPAAIMSQNRYDSARARRSVKGLAVRLSCRSCCIFDSARREFFRMTASREFSLAHAEDAEEKGWVALFSSGLLFLNSRPEEGEGEGKAGGCVFHVASADVPACRRDKGMQWSEALHS